MFKRGEIKTDQERWNRYGKDVLNVFEKNPENFIIEIQSLSNHRMSIIRAMKNFKGKKILEFGSGRGELSIAVSKLGGKVTGIDIGGDLVELAKKTANLNKAECRFSVGSVVELNFEDESFDFVIGNAILHHLSENELKKAVAESYRVLKRNGVAIFSEPVENSFIFNFIQNLLPVGDPESSQFRPSILQRRKWKNYVEKSDDRSLSVSELKSAKGDFQKVYFEYSGMLVRLGRIIHNQKIIFGLNKVDSILTRNKSPLKNLSQRVLVMFLK